MKELLTYIVENLVSDPAAIAITEEIDGDNITYSLRVAPGDMGRVIGRHGRIAKEIRTLMKAAGNRENKRVTVDPAGCTNCVSVFVPNGRGVFR